MPQPTLTPEPPVPAAQALRQSHWRSVAGQGPAVLAYTAWRRAHARLCLDAWMKMNFEVHQIIAVEPWRLQVPERLTRGLVVSELQPGAVGASEGGNGAAADLAALEGLRPAQGVAYAERWRKGHRAYGAWLGRRLAAFVWVRRGPVQLPSSIGCHWQVPASMAWVYDLYSDPGVLGAIAHLYAYLRRHPPGDRLLLLVGQTDAANHRSRAAHHSLGYREQATLWSLRLGGWGVHLTHSTSSERETQYAPRWRLIRGQAHVPVHLLANPSLPGGEAGGESRDVTPAQASPAATLRLQCACGKDRLLAEATAPCACGRTVAQRVDHPVGNLVQLGPAVPYWGEIPEALMMRVLARAEVVGWRQAVREMLSPSLASYIGDPGRAAFADVLPLAPGARVLDVGAGWGAIAAPLARQYHVVALEGVAARARFIALRQRQDGLENLQAACGDIHQSPLGLGQFDAIIANGVMEWVALADLSESPKAIQLRFLHRLRELLAPGGHIYLAIENRLSAAAFCGERDHSGLPFTGLLPRPLAQLVCHYTAVYRAANNRGYRTYTYTHRGYAALFEQAGLAIENSWMCPAGYNRPDKLVPFSTPAVRFAVGRGQAHGMRRWLRHELARGWTCRWLGSCFAFRLRAITDSAHA